MPPPMQSRRILHLAFRGAGAEAQPQLETNSMITLWSSLRFGGPPTILPSSFRLLCIGWKTLQRRGPSMTVR